MERLSRLESILCVSVAICNRASAFIDEINEWRPKIYSRRYDATPN